MLDTGDFLGGPEKPYGYDTELMLDIMKMIGYDAVTIGDSDLRRGLDYVKQSETRGGFKIVAANLFRGGEARVRPFPPYVVKKVGKTRFGIIGLIGKDEKTTTTVQSIYLDQMKLEQDNLGVTDPFVALKEILPEVQKKSDVVVVLAHTGIERAQEMATLVPGVDIVLAGHGGRQLDAPQRPLAILAKCGQRSDKLGTLRIVAENDEVTFYEGATITLVQDKSPIHKSIRALVYEALLLDEFGNKKTNVTRRVAGDSTATATAAAPKDTAAAKVSDEDRDSRLEIKGDHFLGVSSCKDCHISQWAQWSGTTHATAYQRLAEGDDWNNHACLPCHVTGYAAPGGHSASSLSPDLWNVQCEECHGMGSHHTMSGLEVAEDGCLNCHTKDQDPDFDFATAIIKVLH